MIPKDIAVKELLMKVCALLLVTESGMSVRVHTDSNFSTSLKEGVFQKSPIRPTSLNNIENSPEQITRSTSFLYKRQLQCSGGSTIQRDCNINRVDSRSTRLSTSSPEIRICSSNGLNCDKPQQKCSLYMSPCPDQQTVTIDFFNK